MKTLLSIDVEDWFQVENLKQAIDKDSWGDKISRIDRNINLILDLLKQNDVKATFFVLGWIAERYPSLIKKIHNEGHEIACHGYNHELVYALSPEKFLQDVFNIYHLFDLIVSSYNIKIKKPDPKIYEYTLEKLGLKPEETVFIDDLEENTIAATALGIQSIIFKNSEQCKEDLEKILNS